MQGRLLTPPTTRNRRPLISSPSRTRTHPRCRLHQDRPVAGFETARSHESNYAAPLLDAVHARGFSPLTCAMDMGYDSNRVYDEARERGCVPIIPRKKSRLAVPLSTIPHGSDEWKRLYRGRSAVEREFGRLKHHYALAMLRVRGIERVRLHTDLTMLARLALALKT